MSQPRPIHQPPREIQSQPHEAEPSFSYERDSFLLDKGDKEEDEFHRRSQLSTRRETGGSFWRRSGSSGDFTGPNFSSMSMKERQESVGEISSDYADATMATPLGKKIREAGLAKDSKKMTKQRLKDRRMKLEAHNSDIDLGYLEISELKLHTAEQSLGSATSKGSARSRGSASDNSSLIYGKALSASRNGALLGKSTSLIFPTGVEASGEDRHGVQLHEDKTEAIKYRLSACETIRWPIKKKLALENMRLTHMDIPVKDIVGTTLGNTLHKLSLLGNRLREVPSKLVQSLPILKTLDLSQCDLAVLPEVWNLPQLKKLNLSHNKLAEFPEETMLEGLPDLTDLNMYGNKVTEIIIPRSFKALAKLEILDLGYNEITYLPDDLDQLKSLRILRVMNNFLERIPMRVCEMDLKTIDVASNLVVQPPIETCERGIGSMRRYYKCLRQEEQSKHRSMEAFQKKKKGKREEKKLSKINRLFSLKYPSQASDVNHTAVGLTMEPELTHNRARSLSFDDGITDHDGNDNSVKSETSKAKSVSSVRKSKARLDLFGVSVVDQGQDQVLIKPEDAVVNETLKVIFVGMAMTGKTSMIRRLIEGRTAFIPDRDDRTVGVDIYQWNPRNNKDRPSVDCSIDIEDKTITRNVDVKFSVWDFAGQQVYHATHELFFSPFALYVVVWDMGATNELTFRRKSVQQDRGEFSLRYDSSDEEEDDDVLEEERRRAEKALERDIDEKVQFWVECIESCAPGAAILPVASFNDKFKDNKDEGQRRCNVLKQRILKHEERRTNGIKERLEQYAAENRANDEAAVRLRKLVRPKFIFGGNDCDSVIRVSGTEYTGFDKLTEKIVHVATGKDKAGFQYPIFRGHVGARIPRMRLEVRDAVRQMRDRFKVVEWGYFISNLRERGLTNVEDIGDALHFLTNTGELSYFGTDILDHQKGGISHVGTAKSEKCLEEVECDDDTLHRDAMDDCDVDIDDDYENAVLSIDDTSLTAPTAEEDGSASTYDEFNPSILSQYIFLNPRWLVAAVACILRHDLDREIREVRRAFSSENRSKNVYEGNLIYPVITAEDASLLWQAKKFTKKAADRAQEYSNNMKITPFLFLQRLLIRFGVFVPIDLSIEKTYLGGRQYSSNICAGDEPPMTIEMKEEPTRDSQFFFLPSLLGPGEPSEAWTYKSSDSWRTTICHSIFFPDGVPPGLMERVTAAVLSTVYAVSKGCKLVVKSTFHDRGIKTVDGQLKVKEILCWRTAFFLKLGTEVKSENGELKESIVEIFTHLVDQDSHLCVGSDFMGFGTRRLVMSAKGQEGDGGRKIWRGGYLLVVKSVAKIMADYGGLEYEKQGFCPECLTKKAVSAASSWDWSVMRDAVKHGEKTMRCQHGHRVDTRLITGPPRDSPTQQNVEMSGPAKLVSGGTAVPIHHLLRGIVLVGLWDGKLRKVVRVGSGFIADKKRGLIVTASHTLMNIWGEKSTPFGEDYYGLQEGKIVIGVIPRQKDLEDKSTEAVFRYFARIVAKDPNIEERGECHVDACVLKITTRMENDIVGNGDGCGDQPEILLLNNQDALRREKLQQLKMTEKCELDEQVRILGYNQGGEGLLGPGESLNRYFDFARGYVCKKFAGGKDSSGYLRHRFKPQEEIVVICPTIGGHSGGPCVNQQGEVIGILSRADPAEKQRCYLVPSYEW
eukprot:CAMPEP_0178932680 /NCGR_PEP_ID=MMETSP0786-20121207/22772_1 /TAXON_ID=186022 /ORGANISM="Thalassionema frauenfeldii, Strain CCMP 1798" /LENGTH=1673 /DNA_ID=CAMNT_0020610039 /DNA_START=172 /DNA_END=5190 /DNA_ORIENTATION=-